MGNIAQFAHAKVAWQSVDTTSTQKLLRKVVHNMTNSMLIPADSLKATLHFPNREGNCFYCNEVINFVAGLNRYVGNSGIRCKEAK